MLTVSEIAEKHRQGDYAASLAMVEQFIKDNEVLRVLHIAGLSLTKNGDYVRGADWLTASLSLSFGPEEWFINAALAFQEQNRHAQALPFLENGLRIYPQSVQLAYLLGITYAHLHRHEEAFSAFDHAIGINPKFYPARYAKGFTYQLMGNYDEAKSIYATLTDPVATLQDDIQHNLSWMMMDHARWEDALRHIEENCEPSDRATFNASIMKLGLGHWPEAWEQYQSRRTQFKNDDQTWRHVLQPLAKSENDLRGKRVLFFHEQGFGDTIQFLRYAALIEPLAKQFIIQVPTKMVPLATKLALHKPFTVISTQLPEGAADVALSTMDAPAIFRTTTATIPPVLKYVGVHPERASRLPWTGKLHVGLLWSGASRQEDLRAHIIDKRRSMPFSMMERLLDLSHVYDFVSLQMPEDGKKLVDDPRLCQPLKDEFDWLDTARVVQQLDLVVAVDSAVAHLAATLGKPVWLLNRFDGCWRWFWDGRTDSPWYPTMRIFHQKTANDWNNVIEDVYNELQTYFARIASSELRHG